MNMQEIRERAKYFGIKTARMSKVNLVKAIQLSEGNFSCFASAQMLSVTRWRASGVATVFLLLKKCIVKLKKINYFLSAMLYKLM